MTGVQTCALPISAPLSTIRSDALGSTWIAAAVVEYTNILIPSAVTAGSVIVAVAVDRKSVV